ncbi:protein phosphatase [Aspergillus fumigatus]|nr:protein phosphatase [Aspergillus fumigatus]
MPPTPCRIPPAFVDSLALSRLYLLGRIDKLYAFTYQPPPPEREFNGWELYNARKEWARQGVGCDGNDNGWRISEINTDYGVNLSLQSSFMIPVLTSDVSVFTDIPCPSTGAVVDFRQYAQLRSSLSVESTSTCPDISPSHQQLLDYEKLTAFKNDSPSSTQGDVSSGQMLTDLTNAEELEDEMLESFRGNPEERPQIYGAQQHNLIVDARPTVNAFAMQAVGLGSENMDNYKFATKAYLGIDNIHVMRDSLNKVVDALKDSDVTPLGPNRDQLARSGWLKHIAGILDGAGLIARQVGLQHSHVLIHCSDGWDRTGQLSALSQICLDPYFRTMEGFMVLVEKDWLSFGHMFRHRTGPLSSEKWFQIENERIGGDSGRPFGEGGGASKAIENAFLSAKGFFNRDNTSRDSLPDSEGEMQNYDSDSPRKPGSAPRSVVSEKEVTKVKETSPVFHQFLDATYQLLYQYPTRFEFNERFLRRLLYHLYSCQYGTFLFNSEKERVEMKAKERTRSVWDYFLARREQFLNPKYDPLVDDHKRGKERLIFPRINEVRWWSEAFGRTDAEMNGVRSASVTPSVRRGSPASESTPVLTGIETAHHAVGSGASGNVTNNATSTGMAAVASGISNLSFSKGKESSQEPKNLSQMELEMQ